MRFEDLVGMTLTSVEVQGRDAELVFTTDAGRVFKLFHEQDCCEAVYIDDICGELQDLVGSPILLAEEVSNQDLPAKDEAADSYTWTFYKLATVRGAVTIRWYGESNGYYSEAVDFGEVQHGGK